MTTLVFLEHHDGELQKGALGVLAQGRRRSAATSPASCVGTGVARRRRVGGRATAPRRSTSSTTPALAAPLPQPRVDALEAVVAASPARRTSSSPPRCSRPTSPRGSRRGSRPGLNWDLTDLRLEGGELVGKRPALGDTVLVDVGWTSTPRLAPRPLRDVRPGRDGRHRRRCRRSRRHVRRTSRRAARLVEQRQEEASGPSIEDADVIVAGGRGLGEPGGLHARRGARDGARRRGRRDARGRRRRLVPVLDAGRPDRQVGLAEALHRARHLRRDPAQGRHAELRARSSRSTRTRTRRSSTSPTSASSATCTQIAPKLDRARAGASEADERVRAGRLPAAVRDRRGDRRADRRAGRADRRRRPDRRRRARRARVRDPARPAARGAPGHARAARRRARSRCVEKGKQPGSHLLSGAVMNPRAIRRLFEGRLADRGHADLRRGARRGRLPAHEGRALRIPPPPTMRNHGNWVVSVSQLGRFLAEQAEAGGAMILPETAGQKLLVEHGRVVGVRTGDKGRGKDGRAARELRAGRRHRRRRITVLAEGTAGHLTTAAIDHFGLHGRQPADLGARRQGGLAGPEAAAADRPHAWAGRCASGRSYGEFGGSWIYPMGEDMSRSASSSGSSTATSSSPRTTCCRSSRRTGSCARSSTGGERVAWGAKTITEGGFHSMPSQAQRARGCCSSARAPGSSTCRG